MATTASGGFQGGKTVNLNAVDLGAAYLPENPGPDQGHERRAGAPTR